MLKTKKLKKRDGCTPRENYHVSFGSRLPCERLSFQRDSRTKTWNWERLGEGWEGGRWQVDSAPMAASKPALMMVRSGWKACATGSTTEVKAAM